MAEIVSRCPVTLSLGATHIEEPSVFTEGHRKGPVGAEGPVPLGTGDSSSVVDVAQPPSPDYISRDCRIDVCMM